MQHVDGMRKVVKGHRQDFIRAKKDLAAGDMVRVDDLEFLRPCPEDALPPYKLEKILDKELVENIKSGDYIKWTSIK